MPTGYTAAVARGEVNHLKPFALSCARAFGALVMMRDEPGDAPVTDAAFRPTDYHTKAIAAAEAMLLKVGAMTDAECVAEAESDHLASVKRFEEQRRENAETAERYNAMLRQVHAWQAPTAEHLSLKDFMLQQLHESLRFDCDYLPEITPSLSASEWRAAQIAQAQKDIAYHAPKHREEVERCAQRKAWYEALVGAL